MRRHRAKATFIFARRKFNRSLKNVRPAGNRIEFSKEEVLLNKLESKLGKPKEEVKTLISNDLMNLLTMVPFSTKEK
ncbi:hypothetical protein RCC89_16810 [Cytophagaceae bacterium ABcell3]|nr:hypothetical protein RCC89_16810 [Cytophagaceae bacterium ABcell3]